MLTVILIIISAVKYYVGKKNVKTGYEGLAAGLISRLSDTMAQSLYAMANVQGGGGDSKGVSQGDDMLRWLAGIARENSLQEDLKEKQAETLVTKLAQLK